MIVYAIILWIIAAVFAVMAVLIYKGNTNLIHDYHQTKVTDKAAYGKAFGKAFGTLPVAMTLSGVIGLYHIWIALAVLAIGFAAGFAAILRVQKKYNGGVFA